MFFSLEITFTVLLTCSRLEVLPIIVNYEQCHSTYGFLGYYMYQARQPPTTKPQNREYSRSFRKEVGEPLLNAKTEDGMTPLHCENYEAAELLLQKGAIPT